MSELLQGPDHNSQDWKKFVEGQDICTGPIIHEDNLFGITPGGVVYKTSVKSGGSWTKVEIPAKPLRFNVSLASPTMQEIGKRKNI